jgi:phenylalanine-4-hydroxylase
MAGAASARCELGALKHLGRLYWYTVEFGLIAEPEGLRIYGAGIVSSFAKAASRSTIQAPTASPST